MAVLSPNSGQAVAKTDLADIQLVIFDFDGVIADSEIISLSTLRHALAAHDIPLSEDEVRARFLGRSLRLISEFVEDNAPPGSADGFADTWQSALFAAFRASLEPVPSVLSLIDHLDERSLPYCVASSSTFERIGVALDAMALAHRFEHLFSAEVVARGKPAPDLFLHAAEEMGVAPDACLVVEDSPYGAEAAKRAKMRCAGFVGGAHLAPFKDSHGNMLLERGADFVITSHEALIPMGLGVSTSST